MSKRIYVGNLPWSVGKAELEEAFSKFGGIEDAIVITNKYTGRSRGFGFVTYKNEADADKAISEMHEKDFKGRKVLVKEARPRKKDINASAGAAKTSEEKKSDEKESKEKEDSSKEKSTESSDKTPEKAEKSEEKGSEEKEKKEGKEGEKSEENADKSQPEEESNKDEENKQE